MAEAIAAAVIAGRDAAQEQNDQEDDEYRSKRHGALPELSQAAPKRPAARSKPYSGPRVLAPPKRGIVIPGRIEDANLRCAIAHRGISRSRVRFAPRDDGYAVISSS